MFVISGLAAFWRVIMFKVLLFIASAGLTFVSSANDETFLPGEQAINASVKKECVSLPDYKITYEGPLTFYGTSLKESIENEKLNVQSSSISPMVMNFEYEKPVSLTGFEWSFRSSELDGPVLPSQIELYIFDEKVGEYTFHDSVNKLSITNDGKRMHFNWNNPTPEVTNYQVVVYGPEKSSSTNTIQYFVMY
jgi:hypothetical protein